MKSDGPWCWAETTGDGDSNDYSMLLLCGISRITRPWPSLCFPPLCLMCRARVFPAQKWSLFPLDRSVHFSPLMDSLSDSQLYGIRISRAIPMPTARRNRLFSHLFVLHSTKSIAGIEKKKSPLKLGIRRLGESACRHSELELWAHFRNYVYMLIKWDGFTRHNTEMPDCWMGFVGVDIRSR